MNTRLKATLTVLLAALVAAPAVLAADATIEGTVASTTLTKCEFKPGTCEGSLVLERKEGGKPIQVTVKVPKGTAIKKGNDHLFLPGLKGQTVAVTYAEDKGEKVAKAIEVKPAKP
jgi:hypothetical protein